jgi:hypothetical protein
MELEKGDSVVLHDKHSEYDGEVGEITRISETMFGDENYTVSFEAGGTEQGVPADSLDPVEENGKDDGNGDGDGDGDAGEVDAEAE